MQIFDYSFIQNHSGNSARSFNHHHNGNWALSFNHHHIGNWAHSFNHHHNGNWAHSFNHYHNGNCSSFMQSQWQLQLIHAIIITMATAAHSCNLPHVAYFFQFDVQQHIFLIKCTLENILFTVQAKDQWCEWKRESEFVDTENIIPFI